MKIKLNSRTARSLLIGGAGSLGAAVLVAGAYGSGTVGSATQPSSIALASNSTSSQPARHAHHGYHGRPGMRGILHHHGFHVVDEYFSKKTNSVVTVTLDFGKLTSATASAITISEPNGASVTENIVSTTHFRGLPLSVLEGSSANTPVRVVLVQKDGVLVDVGARHMRSSSATGTSSSANSNSSATAGA